MYNSMNPASLPPKSARTHKRNTRNVNLSSKTGRLATKFSANSGGEYGQKMLNLAEEEVRSLLKFQNARRKVYYTDHGQMNQFYDAPERYLTFIKYRTKRRNKSYQTFQSSISKHHCAD
jgi:hypothetical protein